MTSAQRLTVPGRCFRCLAAMAPHAGDVLTALKKATRNWHSDVREAAYGAMGEVAKAAGGEALF